MDKIQRLILANQYRILSELKSDDTYKKYVDILDSGYSSEYYKFIDIDDELNKDDQSTINDIVAMYESIYSRLNKFSKEEKDYILNLKKSFVYPLSDFYQNKYLKFCLKNNVSPYIKDQIRYHNTSDPLKTCNLSYYAKMINQWNNSYPNLNFDKICKLIKSGDEPSFKSHIYAKKIRKIKKVLKKHDREKEYRNI